MNTLLTIKLKSLPEELENKILQYVHSYNVYEINKQIKDSLYGFNELQGGVFYEWWFHMNLKVLPKECWKKISKHHKRYGENYYWHSKYSEEADFWPCNKELLDYQNYQTQ